MSIRLSKAIKELNVGRSTIIDFLNKKGIQIEDNPNTKIEDNHYQLLVKEFSADKELRDTVAQQQAERLKEKKVEKADKKVIKSTPEVIETTVAEDLRPQLTIKGHIDLEPTPKKKDKKEKKERPEKVEKSAAKTQEIENVTNSKVEVPVVTKEEKENVVPAPPVQEKELEEEIPSVSTSEIVSQVEVEETSQPIAPKATDEVFRLSEKPTLEGPKVLGTIDLSAINSSTRPKKKTKEERQKERQEKNANNGDRKKRNRIGKERVDVNVAANQTNGNNNNSGRNNKNKNNQNKAQGQNNSKGKGQNNRNKQPAKVEISEEDVAKQVKETLARLTNKGKGQKGAKYRKEKREQIRQQQEELRREEKAASTVLKLTEFVTANELATMMDVPVTKVIGTCMSIGIMVSINQRLDAETIDIVAEEFGFTTEYISAEVSEAVAVVEDSEEDLLPRAPIVTVMGHVDHGKTSLLDHIRKANVIAGEAGGITQHIGAYNVTLQSGRQITFLDTPGHEAFTAMRARGAQVTDIAIIIIAADDGVMPQTKEAINHATAAGVPIVFAINKIDKPGANPDKIKEELASMNYLVEEWGGKYQSQDIAAKQGLNVRELLDKVLLEADMLELKANPNRQATGTIIESSLDKGRGYVATVLVSNGTLKQGDIILAGTSYGRIKALFNERNNRIDAVGPAQAATILGFNGAPQAGDQFYVMDTEQEAREIAVKREQLQREQNLRTTKMLTLDELGRRIKIGSFQELNIIVKGDVDGSVEALSDSFIRLSTEKIAVNVIHKSVGQISENDITLAAASQAVIVGFQVRPSQAARRQAEHDGVEIRLYSVIYDAIEEVKQAMEGMLEPIIKEEVTATVEVRQVYNISKVGVVAGAYVVDGRVSRSDKARLIRDGIVIFTGSLAALKRFKDDVKEVTTNFECGISLQGCNDIKEGDMIETFQEIEVKQKL